MNAFVATALTTTSSEGGVFSHWTRLRVSLAWEAFGIKNGARSLAEMQERVEFYRRVKPAPHEDYEIGCILLQQPFFLASEDWLPVPDWHQNIVREASPPSRALPIFESPLSGTENPFSSNPASGRDRSRSWSWMPTSEDAP